MGNHRVFFMSMDARYAVKSQGSRGSNIYDATLQVAEDVKRLPMLKLSGKYNYCR